MMWNTLLVLFALLHCEQLVNAAVVEKRVTSGFKDPPKAYRPKFRYWYV